MALTRQGALYLLRGFVQGRARICFAFAVAFLLMFQTGSFSQQARFGECFGPNLQHRIEACGSIIAKGRRESKSNRIAAYLNRGEAYRAAGDLDRAIDDVEHALQLDPKSAQAYADRAALFYDKGARERAITDYTQALAFQPRFVLALLRRAEAFRAGKQWDAAIADYRRVLDIDPAKVEAYVGRGDAYLAKGDVDRALSDFTEAIGRAPKSAELYSKRGTLFRSKGELDNALRDFSEAIQLNPELLQARVDRADMYRAQGNLPLARQDLEAALRVDPEFRPAIEASATLSQVIEAQRAVRAPSRKHSPLESAVIFQIGPVAITHPVVTTWAIMLALSLGSWLVTRSLPSVPDRRAAVLELIVMGVMQQIEDVLRKDPRPYLSLLGTLFIFLVAANLSSLVPGAEAPTSKLETPAALALIVFFSVHYFGIRSRGLRKYLASFAEPKFIMLPLNILSEVTRTFSLMVRLFGNVMSGEFMIALVVSLAGLFVPVPLMLLEGLLGIIQAYIFTVLATVFIGAAIGSIEKG
ncbi:F0F1 ATP synthase subunit A [Methylocystis sp. WRRC1]|jgi:F-type H+-transporting ATPase subunit a|uniref:F0F1 ATP synthase subunit A n=1 Tax=Methylocystis sp. WRRC1 TaxID=1732014 RepID=UPI00351D0341